LEFEFDELFDEEFDELLDDEFEDEFELELDELFELELEFEFDQLRLLLLRNCLRISPKRRTKPSSAT
jgi:hypothetical protein